MFEFEPDEYLFTKLVNYFKKRKKAKQVDDPETVYLDDIRQRMTIIARALTGRAIDIYPAEREGGYKNNNFFLPEKVDFFSFDTNVIFYLYRVLYMSIQQSLDMNWKGKGQHTTVESRSMALDHSREVIDVLLAQYPGIRHYYPQWVEYFRKNVDKGLQPDYSFLYGKWMSEDDKNAKVEDLKNFSDYVKKVSEDPKTTLKAKAIEEIISVQVDQKQVEDAVLLHQFEKVETAEEFGGNFRDMDGDDDLDDHAGALEDLQMKHTVRVDDAVHSIYQAEFVENATVAESTDMDFEGYYLTYDEWDYRRKSYKKDYCKVYPTPILEVDSNYYKHTIHTYRTVLLNLQKTLTSLNNKWIRQRRQPQGEDIDIDALTDLYVDVKSGHTPSEKVYLSKRKKEKDLSILILLDTSLSSDGYASGNKIIDVERQISIIFGEILDEHMTDFALCGFFSKTRNHCGYQVIKDFDTPWAKAKWNVGAVRPGGYTRIGPALRHSGAMLDLRPAKNKWLVLISDGKPNDYDRYEGSYGINDVKQALRELKQKDIHAFALTIEAQAKYYLPQMFGVNAFKILTSPVEMLTALVHLYERIKLNG